MKRQRGRGRKPGGGGGGGHHNPNRTFESNGPDVKVRGSAQTIFEKYQQLARDAQSSGDRVMAENYLQHAEHYFRIVRASQPQHVFVQQQDGGRGFDDDEMDDGSDEGDEADTEAEAAPRPQREFRQHRDGGRDGQRDAPREGGFRRERGERFERQRDGNRDGPREGQRDGGFRRERGEGEPRRPRNEDRPDERRDERRETPSDERVRDPLTVIEAEGGDFVPSFPAPTEEAGEAPRRRGRPRRFREDQDTEARAALGAAGPTAGE
jgi:hypothetical protein